MNDTIRRIKSEIETLKQQQAEALNAATFLGLIPIEAKAQEERRAKITQLMRDLSNLVEHRNCISDGSVTVRHEITQIIFRIGHLTSFVRQP